MDAGDAKESEQPTGLTGIDLVRRTLEEARAAARAQGKDAGRGRAVPRAPRRVAGRRRSWSGPGPDEDRDPQPLGRLAREVAKRRGWSTRVAEGTVLGHWPSVVGQQIADHATPTALKEGVLTVTAESTAWVRATPTAEGSATPDRSPVGPLSTGAESRQDETAPLNARPDAQGIKKSCTRRDQIARNAPRESVPALDHGRVVGVRPLR